LSWSKPIAAVAAPLQVGILLHLLQVLFMGHPRRHRRVLQREGIENGA
jgi:hypothetical protein